MSSAWTDFLASQSASPGAESPALFGDLRQFSVLRFSGPDAPAFLQGQLTCDVRALPAGQWTWGAYCSAKGRAFANFMLWASADGYRMLLPQAVAPTLAKYLRMFVLRSKVTLEDESEAVVILGIHNAGTPLPALGFNEPLLPFALVARPGLEVMQLTIGRTLIAASLEDAKRCWQGFQGMGHTGSAREWDLLCITQGEPWVLPPVQDAFVPQMLNLEILGGVSFSKGCYPGQEVVARSQHRGEVKRRLYRFRAATGDIPAPGTSLYAKEDTVAGTVVNAAMNAEGSSEMLAVVQIFALGGELRLGSFRGPRLEPCALPYAVPGLQVV